ncbi:hypothetical protein, partial [Niallia sp. 03190]|uniref:hypothetical protein n=1 Tax=Niallia sp. 03190 TaxID=3458061 RepID=UPI00404468E3
RKAVFYKFVVLNKIINTDEALSSLNTRRLLLRKARKTRTHRSIATRRLGTRPRKAKCIQAAG